MKVKKFSLVLAVIRRRASLLVVSVVVRQVAVRNGSFICDVVRMERIGAGCNINVDLTSWLCDVGR